MGRAFNALSGGSSLNEEKQLNEENQFAKFGCEDALCFVLNVLTIFELGGSSSAVGRMPACMLLTI